MKQFVCSLIALLLVLSCSDSPDSDYRIEPSTVQITQLDAALSHLQAAAEQDKILHNLEPIWRDSLPVGWELAFSDGSALHILLVSGARALPSHTFTPFYTHDASGCWAVSHDACRSYTHLTQSPQALSDAVALHSYAVIFSSITQNHATQQVSFEMADGTLFHFRFVPTQPTRLELSCDRLFLATGGESRIDFQVHPPQALVPSDSLATCWKFELALAQHLELHTIAPVRDSQGRILAGRYQATVHDVSPPDHRDTALVLRLRSADGLTTIASPAVSLRWSGSCEIESFALDGSLSAHIHNNFISVQMPYGCHLANREAYFEVAAGTRVYVGDELQQSGESYHDFRVPVQYRVVSPQGAEKLYWVSVSYSNLPMLYITTPQPVSSKYNWVVGTRVLVANANEHNRIYDRCGIKGRGNSTWTWPKHPYILKLERRKGVLGMPEHKRWVLLANWVDKTQLRNALAFEVARNTQSLEWTPRGQFVEVVMNGTYRGTYYLCEQIRIDENRVDLAEMQPSDTQGKALTGGYLIEMDTYPDDSPHKFGSLLCNFPVHVKSPDDDDLHPTQFAYIQNYVDAVEKALYESDFAASGRYKELLDVHSFIDWWFVHEIMQNAEACHPKSTYMHKDRGGLLKAGPVWDFDYATLKPHVEVFYLKHELWYTRLFKDPSFVALVKEKWAASKERFVALASFIDAQQQHIRPAADYNARLWPITDAINGDQDLSFDAAVAQLRAVYLARIAWLDAAINDL